MGDSFQQTNNDQSTGVQGSQNVVNINHRSPEGQVAALFESAILVCKQLDLTWKDVGLENPAYPVSAYPTPADLLVDASIVSKIDMGTDDTPEDLQLTADFWCDRLKSLAVILLKGGVVVGQAVAESYARSPVVAGLVAAFKYANKQI